MAYLTIKRNCRALQTTSFRNKAFNAGIKVVIFSVLVSFRYCVEISALGALGIMEPKETGWVSVTRLKNKLLDLMLKIISQ